MEADQDPPCKMDQDFLKKTKTNSNTICLCHLPEIQHEFKSWTRICTLNLISVSAIGVIFPYLIAWQLYSVDEPPITLLQHKKVW